MATKWTLACPCFPVLEVDMSTILQGRPLITTCPFFLRAEHCMLIVRLISLATCGRAKRAQITLTGRWWKHRPRRPRKSRGSRRRTSVVSCLSCLWVCDVSYLLCVMKLKLGVVKKVCMWRRTTGHQKTCHALERILSPSNRKLRFTPVCGTCHLY